MKSKNLDKNVKKIYEYCFQNFLKDAQDLLEYNLEQSGNFFIKALRLYLYNGKEIDTKEICEKYQGLQNLEFGDFEKNFVLVNNCVGFSLSPFYGTQKVIAYDYPMKCEVIIT